MLSGVPAFLAENACRRFPEVVLALGAHGLEESFERWFRITETSGEKKVEVTLRRRNGQSSCTRSSSRSRCWREAEVSDGSHLGICAPPSMCSANVGSALAATWPNSLESRGGCVAAMEPGLIAPPQGAATAMTSVASGMNQPTPWGPNTYNLSVATVAGAGIIDAARGPAAVEVGQEQWRSVPRTHWCPSTLGNGSVTGANAFALKRDISCPAGGSDALGAASVMADVRGKALESRETEQVFARCVTPQVRLDLQDSPTQVLTATFAGDQVTNEYELLGSRHVVERMGSR
eukprot:TRINITY_DN70828_c0_g1_i1.p1 TRINITY_DN70828_c0_g1~~TRINITY_DN70828_c0_g1_i1.p1  ORF type:complete len:303 (-),score=29.36 TRINITY_DN70828_c0_g1_i1:25-897(-)